MSAGQIRAGRAFVEVGGDSAPLSAALARVRAKLSAFGMGLAQLGGTFAAGGVGMLGAIAWPLKLAANMETTRAAFTAMLKDANRAQAVLTDLQKFAASTPFEFPELADAARGLLSFGVSVADLIPTLKAVGDVSSGINAPLGEIAEIYGKARVQGRLFMEDINQLTGRGIPIIQELAKQFGVTESEVRGLVEKGRVNFGNLQRAFVDLTTGVGQFANQMDAKSKTALGKWSTLKDNITQAIQPIGDALLPAVGRILDTLSTMAAVIGQFVKENANLAVYVAGAAAALVLFGGALSGVGFTLMGITAALGFAGGLWASFVAVLTAVGGLIGPALAPVFAFAAAAAGVGMVARNFVDVGAAVRGAGSYLASFASHLQPIRDAAGRLGVVFAGAYDTILAGWQGVVNALAAGDAALALEVVSAGMAVVWEQALGGLRAEWETFTGGFITRWNDAINYFTKLTLNGLANVAMAWNSVVGYIQSNFDMLSNYFMGWIDMFVAAWQEWQTLIQTVVGKNENQAAQELAAIEQTRQSRRDARNEDAAAAARQRADEIRARAAQLQQETAAAFAAVDEQAKQAATARTNEKEQALADARERLKAAQTRFGDLNQAAAAAAEKTRTDEKQNELSKASAEAATKLKGTSAGTFNAAAVRSLGAGYGSLDRTAKATERTAKAAEQLVDRADSRKLVFG